ncbi:PTS sugar transporter subunit IIB [Protaetiibacter mangrovi]|uniref:PTS sugar transporter subunit IIB n=1 Tax=Protaetiibacter mangrovi TaxID=2970926 RepID=A0ABT1ZFT9_9MICO|nr:PTS sugar transporter subunit IIB [Protaetiibacter mangrovi]MCS0499510.1 PTS sugar transporter subunit IIB [Protaetiibacter mangrovi]TPX03027.1 PTS sugar transporter subunit IIB [Schumannella luteola]
MKILTLCGAGIGTSGILKVNAERALQRLGIDARVVAIDASMLESELDDAQVILTGPEFVETIGRTFADVIVVENYFDTAELQRKLENALG